MDFIGSASASFNASHILRGHPRCGRLHGHLWTVEVSIETGQDPETRELAGLPELAAAVEAIAGELDLEHLNDMLPGVTPTSSGVALYFQERLALTFLDITGIRVSDGTVASIVHVR